MAASETVALLFCFASFSAALLSDPCYKPIRDDAPEFVRLVTRAWSVLLTATQFIDFRSLLFTSAVIRRLDIKLLFVCF